MELTVFFVEMFSMNGHFSAPSLCNFNPSVYCSLEGFKIQRRLRTLSPLQVDSTDVYESVGSESKME